MDEDGARKAASSNHTPPPCDPFQRYQTPWPQNREDDENPFVCFRRFADEQFKSMFSGVPFFKRSLDEHFESMVAQHRKETNAVLQEIMETFERSKEDLDQLRQKREQDVTAVTANKQISHTQDHVLERRPPNEPSTELDMYDQSSAERLDPFVNKDDTYPWLLSSPYSPIWLSSPLKAHSGTASESLFPTLCRPNTKDEERIADLRWHSAFQDLLSLERTGQFDEQSRRISTSTALWLTELHRRDFLTFEPKVPSTQAAMVNMWEPIVSSIPLLHLQWQGMRFVNDLWANAGYHNDNDVEDDDVDDDYLEYEDDGETDDVPATSPISVDDVERKSIARTWAQALNAVGQTIEGVLGSADRSSGSGLPKSEPTDGGPSIVSTMTRTETRTLPDGSVETRRVLRRRFADGKEEHEETVDTQPAIRLDLRHLHDSLPPPPANESRKQTQSQTTRNNAEESVTLEDSRERTDSGGWFWR